MKRAFRKKSLRLHPVCRPLLSATHPRFHHHSFSKIKRQMHILILQCTILRRDLPAPGIYVLSSRPCNWLNQAADCGTCLHGAKGLWRTSHGNGSVKESHFQISAEDNGSFVTMRMHAWNPKLSTRAGGTHLVSADRLVSTGSISAPLRSPWPIYAHFGTWAGYAARLVYKWYKIPYVITEHASSINGNQTTPSQAVILKKAYSEARKIICVGTKSETEPVRIRQWPG